MTTLRRELRTKFEEVIVRNGVTSDEGIKSDFWEIVINELADAALSLRAFSFEQKPERRGDILDGILAYANPSQEDEKRAIDAFEQAWGLERPWDWYPDTPDEKRKTWLDFRAYVLKLYRQDNDCFTKYVTWARTDYVKGAMTALGIKRNPENFPDSWSAFKASAMYKKTDEKRGEYVAPEKIKEIQESIDWSKT